MTAKKEFYNLDGKTVNKKYLQILSGRLYKDGAFNEARRSAYIASIINNDEVEIEIEAQGLTGPSQEELFKKALNNCGRLNPGYKFLKGGGIIEIKKDPPAKKEVKKTPANSSKKQSKFIKDKIASTIKAGDDKVFVYRFKKRGTKRVFYAPETAEGKRVSTTMFVRLWEAEHLAASYLKRLVNRESDSASKKKKGGPPIKRGGTPSQKNNKVAKKENGSKKQLGLAGVDSVLSSENSKTNTGNNIEGLRSMNDKPKKAPLWKIAGETGKFLGNVERKHKESVVVILSTPKGTGKTTSAYKWINDFALNDKVLFLSLEEHHESNLATDKEDKYIEKSRKCNISTTSDIPNKEMLYKWIDMHDVIFFDSWQKLIAILGKLDLDTDFRKRFNGKLFVFIVQQTTDGKVRGGATLGFDGDIIVMGYKGASFKDNYLYFDKNRYTRVELDQIHYNIDTHKVVNPKAEAFSKVSDYQKKQSPEQSKSSWLSVS